MSFGCLRFRRRNEKKKSLSLFLPRPRRQARNHNVDPFALPVPRHRIERNRPQRLCISHVAETDVSSFKPFPRRLGVGFAANARLFSREGHDVEPSGKQFLDNKLADVSSGAHHEDADVLRVAGTVSGKSWVEARRRRGSEGDSWVGGGGGLGGGAEERCLLRSAAIAAARARRSAALWIVRGGRGRRGGGTGEREGRRSSDLFCYPFPKAPKSLPPPEAQQKGACFMPRLKREQSPK